jgi:CubicO group peptidase (beta-lactamase class C family)
MPDLGKKWIPLTSICIATAVCLMGVVIAAQYKKPDMPVDTPGSNVAQNVPLRVGMIPGRLELIDYAVESAIREGMVPGAVVLVGCSDRIEYFKAFGNRAIKPAVEPMTKDTVFDISSLTKVIATTPSVMMLVEEGILRLGDRVSQYMPRFKGGGKDDITVRQLLTHYSGLPADFDLSTRWFGYEASLSELWKIRANSKPDKEFVYSDLNFIALGEIVRVLSDQTLDVFANEHLFAPLGMKDTRFSPPDEMIGRIAPTETRRSTLQYLYGNGDGASMDAMVRGEVHDPTAWRMGGIAGHAGLFSTASDVALYARMLLNMGELDGKRYFSPLTVQAMTSPQSPPDSDQIRGYGWDIQSDYSSPRGDIFMTGYGHTGFTGTSLWIHPPTDIYIVILSNRVHPDGGKNMNHLRSVVANIVASAITYSKSLQ